MKKTLLQATDVRNLIKTYDLYETLHKPVSERMNYILNFCVNLVGGEVKWWDWLNDGEGEDRAPGHFMYSYDRCDSHILIITGVWTEGAKMIFLDKEGSEWTLERGEFPTRWLWEDFETEYKNGLKAYQEKENSEVELSKRRRKEKDKEKKALIASAATKLTKEERKAVGLQ
jgi:hypothetical protein